MADDVWGSMCFVTSSQSFSADVRSLGQVSASNIQRYTL